MATCAAIGMRLAVALSAPLFLLAGAGCAHVSPASPTLDAAAPAHIIRVDEAGVLLTLTGEKAEAGYLAEKVVAPLERALAGNQFPKGLLVFVHGGLNNYPDAREHFDRNFEALTKDGYYPIFLIWPSGLVGSYREHVTSVRQGVREESKVGKVFKAVTTPLVFAQDIGVGLVRSPMVVLETLRSDLLTTIPANSGYADQDRVKIYRSLAARGLPIRIGDDYRTKTEEAGRFTAYVATLPAKLVTAGAVIDAFGRPAWDDMLRRSYMVYPGSFADVATPDSLVVVQTAARQKKQRDANASGFGNFIGALENIQWDSHFRLTLVGHSMGTIVLNHLLDATTLDVEKIVYLSAACTVRDYAESVLPYLVNHPDAHAYSLMLHPLAEAGEFQAKLADLPPRGSLLMWIDNFLANPVSEQDRTFGRWTNLFLPTPTGRSAIEDFMLHYGIADSAGKPRVHFRAYGVGHGATARADKFQWNVSPAQSRPSGNELIPETHGDISTIKFWRDEVIDGAL